MKMSPFFNMRMVMQLFDLKFSILGPIRVTLKDDDEDEGIVQIPDIGFTGTQGLKPTVDTSTALTPTPNPNKYMEYGKKVEHDQLINNYKIPEEESTKDYLAYGQELAKTQTESLKQSLKIASLADAEQAAAIQDLSNQTGLPPSFISGNVNEVKRMVSLVSLDADKLASQSPILAKQLKEPLFAAIAYDDLEHLSGLETAAHGVSSTFRAFAAGLPGVTGGAYQALGAIPGSIDAVFDAMGLDTEFSNDPDRFMFANLLNVPQALSEQFQDIAQGQYELADRLQGDISRYSPNVQAMLQGPKSFGMMTPGITAFMMTGNPAFLYGSAGLSSGGMAFTEALEQDMPYATALMYGITQGTTEAAFEMLPALRFMQDLKVGSSLFKTVAAQLLFEVPQEQLTTITQDLTDFAILPSHDDMTFRDYLAARPEAAWHTLLATITGVGSQTTTTFGVNKLLNKYTNSGIKFDPEVRRMIEDEARVKEAFNAQQKIVELAAQIKEAKMLDKSPDSLKGFVRELFQSQVEGEVSEIVIYSQDIAQYAEEQGIAIADISPLIAEQEQEAAENQGYFSFKVEDYLTDIAIGEHGDAINQLLRVNENAMSVQEAGTWNEERNQKLMDQADAIISSMANKDKVAGDEVFNEVVKQLENTGVSRDDANQSAALYKAFFTVMGDRAGIDAKQLYDRYGIELQRNLPGGAIDQAQSQSDGLSELAALILNTEGVETTSKPKLSESEEANVFVEKIKELKKAKQKAKLDASDIENDEEAEKFYEANGKPAEIALIEAEIE